MRQRERREGNPKDKEIERKTTATFIKIEINIINVSFNKFHYPFYHEIYGISFSFPHYYDDLKQDATSIFLMS